MSCKQRGVVLGGTRERSCSLVMGISFFFCCLYLAKLKSKIYNWQKPLAQESHL